MSIYPKAISPNYIHFWIKDINNFSFVQFQYNVIQQDNIILKLFKRKIIIHLEKTFLVKNVGHVMLNKIILSLNIV